MAKIARLLREIFGGRRLARALRHHDRAADELDAVLREVLRQ